MTDFDPDDRQAIEAALNDPDPSNPIATAVAQRMAQFTARLAEQAERHGKWPTELLLASPHTVLDEIVMGLTLETIAEELGQAIEVRWVSEGEF